MIELLAITLTSLLFITSVVVMGSLLYAQKQHYLFLRNKETVKDSNKLSDELQARIKELDELKKRVDVLALKNGFKL